MKNEHIENIIRYFQKTYEKNEILINNGTSHYNLAIEMYNYMENLLSNIHFDKIINNDFDKYYLNINSDNFIGSIVKLKRVNMYVSDINKISINNFYPKTISLLYHNTNIYDIHKSYVYMIDNQEKILLKLNEKEKILFYIFRNYKFGWYSKNNILVMNTVTQYTRNLITHILDNDIYKDIIYIDTNCIYIKNTIQTKKHIEELTSDLYTISEEKIHSILFLAKKKLIYFDETPLKMKGIRDDDFYKNKQIKNIAFDLFRKNNKNVIFAEFKRNDKFRDYLKQAKLIYDRKKKINNILE